MNTLSIQRPLPSITDASLREHVGEVDAGELAALVAIKDLRRAIALERLVQGVQKRASSVLDKRQDRTLRLAQSITATRYGLHHPVVRSRDLQIA